MIDADTAVEALDRLDSEGITAWVGGGWGIDALVGEQTREHGDLDLVVAQSTLDAARSALSTLGYEYAAAVKPGLPARVVLLDAHRLQIDLPPVVFDGWGTDGSRLATRLGVHTRPRVSPEPE
jgi:lincosamide nucleotidyltransferase A/C/D/E